LIKKILILLLTLLLSILFFLFQDRGNQLISPYIANYLEHKTGGVRIEIQRLKIDANRIEFDVLLNGLVKLKGEGQLSLLTKKLDLDYTLTSDSLKHNVDVNGTVIGSFYDMHIAGSGAIFNSTIDYQLYREESTLHAVRVKIDNADIASFLELTSQPPYATGSVDVDVAIPNLEQESSKTNAKIRFHETTLNTQQFRGLEGREIGRNIRANLNLKVSNRGVQLEGFAKSNVAKLNLYNARYDRGVKLLKSDYTLFVSKLSATLEVQGAFHYKNSHIALTGNSQSLGGETHFRLHDNQLDAYLNGVKIEKLLAFLGEKPYATGLLMADVTLSDVTQPKGVFHFKTQEAQLVNVTLKELFNLEFEKSLPLLAKGKGVIEGERVTMQSHVDVDVLQYDASDILYNLTTQVLKSHYKLQLPKLSKFNRAMGKTLKGELSVRGELNYDKVLMVTGESFDLGGDVDFNLKADKLKMQLNSLSVEKLLAMFSYPKLFKAKLVGSVEYDFATHRGVLHSHLNETELLSNALIKVIEKIKGKHIESRHYDKTSLNASFQEKVIGLDFKAKNKRVLLSIPKGVIDRVKKQIYADYRVKIDEVVLEGEIKGALSNPEVTFNSAKYLQNNMMSVIEETIPSPAVRGFKMGKKNHDTMKNMMFDFFK